MVVFKMRDSVPSPRYLLVCNVLRQWKTSLIPTYRVYRLYDKRMFVSLSESVSQLPVQSGSKPPIYQLYHAGPTSIPLSLSHHVSASV